MQLVNEIPVWGTPDPGAVEQIRRVAETALSVALMADHRATLPYGY